MGKGVVLGEIEESFKGQKIKGKVVFLYIRRDKQTINHNFATLENQYVSKVHWYHPEQ